MWSSRGAVLARFDTEGLQAEEAELEAGLAQATTEAARAKADFARTRLLRGGGGLSEQDALQYQTRSEATAASVDASAARLAGKRWQLKEAVLRAPDSGVISSRSASTGQVSTPGQEMFRLIRLQRLEWRGELSAASLAEVRAGPTVSLSLPDGSTASARIRQLAPAMNPSTRLGTVYADIATASHARAGR